METLILKCSKEMLVIDGIDGLDWLLGGTVPTPPPPSSYPQPGVVITQLPTESPIPPDIKLPNQVPYPIACDPTDGIFPWNVVHYDDKYIRLHKDFVKCQHEWKDYHGLNEQFSYCSKCDKKKGE